MEPSDKTMVRFYQLLGKLFYCIAAADNTIRKEEINQLKKIVQKEWLPLENTFDEFGSDSGYQIEIVFDWLINNQWDIENVFFDFKIFREEHQHLFTTTIKELILKTAEAIAKSFSGKNKSESVLISKLIVILQENY
ncbi:hypothetical protein AB3G34_13690 [Flavobacterium sp. WC2409]|uniref:TerB family tellurite resistance protein n=1 Tax=Flavobacterium sp. WC2409 TaxID=3234139 RepID=A0AB39W3N2_9FLAO